MNMSEKLKAQGYTEQVGNQGVKEYVRIKDGDYEVCDENGNCIDCIPLDPFDSDSHHLSDLV